MPSIRVNRAKEKLQKGEVVTTISGLHSSDIIDFLGPIRFAAASSDCEQRPLHWAPLGHLTRA